MTWKISYLASVRKDIRKLNHHDHKRIRKFLEERIAKLEDPRSIGKALKGKEANFWRYRVGSFRIICDIRDGELVVLVVRVGHRREIYRQ